MRRSRCETGGGGGRCGDVGGLSGVERERMTAVFARKASAAVSVLARAALQYMCGSPLDHLTLLRKSNQK